MNNKYYYIDFINNKFRICKEYISHIQDDSIYETYEIEFINGITRKNNEVFRQRRKARQFRDKCNRRKKYETRTV